MNILADASLPPLTPLFTDAFRISYYHNEVELKEGLKSNEILICRSTLIVNEALLSGSSIRCVATASSGIDHIDTTYLTQQGITLFDAKGSNARAVADYVMASLAYLLRQNKVTGVKAGVIGVGAVGTKVAQRLKSVGFDVLCFDPIKALENDKRVYCSLDELTGCALLCVHANYHQEEPYPSANLISTPFLEKLNPGTSIINAARGGIVDEEAILNTSTPLIYCTDVYLKEPTINKDIVNLATLCTPHIAGHSIEAKEQAVFCLSQALHEHYHLEKPSPLTRKLGKKMRDLPKMPWQSTALMLYNPIKETNLLKNALDKRLAFIKTRQAHQNRHDFPEGIF